MNLKLGEIKIDKKEFHNSKKPVDFNLADTNEIVASDKFEFEEGDKYYIGYKDGEFVRPLPVILTQMSGFIKYFDSNRKNVPYLSEDEEIIIKYNKIWKKTTKTNGFELDSQPFYDKTYIKTNLRHMMIKSILFFQTLKFQKKKLIIIALQQFILILY